MKYASGLFGWFDRRLIQTEDQDVVRRKLIDADFNLNRLGIFDGKNPGLGFFCLIVLLIGLITELGAICCGKS